MLPGRGTQTRIHQETKNTNTQKTPTVWHQRKAESEIYNEKSTGNQKLRTKHEWKQE